MSPSLPVPQFYPRPVVESGADPWVTWHDGYFYYCYVLETDKDVIYVNRAKRLENIDKGKPSAVWGPTHNKPYSRNIWAPEMHFLRGKWYIYFAADNTPTNVGPSYPHHRMYVIESATDNPLGSYTYKGKINDVSDCWAIDGTVLELTNGNLYFLWSGWPTKVLLHEEILNTPQNIYIAPMSNPWTISGPRVCISTPTYRWEKRVKPYVNEGPQVLWRNNKLHIIYSASGSWTDDYCLGRLTLTGEHMLDPASWTKEPKPIFTKKGAIYGPGHASFITADNQEYGWMIYHAARHSKAGWDRQVRLVAFRWEEDHMQFMLPSQRLMSMPALKGHISAFIHKIKRASPPPP